MLRAFILLKITSVDFCSSVARRPGGSVFAVGSGQANGALARFAHRFNAKRKVRNHSCPWSEAHPVQVKDSELLVDIKISGGSEVLSLNWVSI